MTKVGINGFGRIGRLTLRAILEKYKSEIQVVAINDLTDPATNAHLFKFDSTYGPFKGEVSSDTDEIIVGGQRIRSFFEKDPASIDWTSAGVQVVVECTGKFTDRDGAQRHLGETVKKVLISAPAKGEDLTVVLGVNESRYDPSAHTVISNASCTTNALAPMCRVLVDSFGIDSGLMTTIHAYTNDQKVQDQAHKDLRRARAAGQNIIPTSTGAAKAIGLVVPELIGKMQGFAVRVPTPTVSLVDLTVTLGRAATVNEINDAMRAAANGAMSGILSVSDEPCVSTDFTGSHFSCVVDSALTTTSGDRLAKVIGWYDNEWAYALRVADLIKFIADKGL